MINKKKKGHAFAFIFSFWVKFASYFGYLSGLACSYFVAYLCKMIVMDYGLLFVDLL